MASSSKPCQRCIKSKAECKISSSFRPGKPSGAQTQGQSKRPLAVVGDNAGHSTRQKKNAVLSLDHDGERIIPVPRDSGM
jgi:hypothetical protein